MRALLHELLRSIERLRIVMTLAAAATPDSAAAKEFRQIAAALRADNINLLADLERDEAIAQREVIARVHRLVDGFYRTRAGSYASQSAWWQDNGHILTIRVADCAQRVMYLLGDEAA